MILDRLENADRYHALHPLFPRAFKWLAEANSQDLQPGSRIELDGKRLFVIVDHRTTRGPEDSPLEIHHDYIDIQFALQGTDEMGWLPANQCSLPQAEFDTDRDIQFFDDQASLYVSVPPGTYAIFFPEDAHAPLAAPAGQEVRKLIVKVAVDVHASQA